MSFIKNDLIKREELEILIINKSALIIDANHLKESGMIEEANGKFIEAAHLEERIAAILKQVGNDDDYSLSIISAASCWKQAGLDERAKTLFDRVLITEIHSKLKNKAEKLRNECDKLRNHLENNISIRAIRILLILKYCSDEGKDNALIVGLTRLAKLDFFLRYPKHLIQAINKIITDPLLKQKFIERIPIEDALLVFNRQMVRHKFGPWDHNYYNVFAFLTSKGLISIKKDNSTFIFQLETRGEDAISKIEKNSEFEDYINTARVLADIFSDFLGSKLKGFIYENFTEIANAKVGETLWD